MIKKNNWKKLWKDLSYKDEFTSMGRSSYSLQNFLKYSLDCIENLKPIKKNSIFLDCGGGTGLFSWILIPFVKKIYLIDFSDQMIQLAKKRFNNQKKIKIFVKDIRNIKFKDKIKFDRVIFGSVLQYLNNYSEIDKIFFNLNKLTKKNSKILFTHNPDILKKSIHIKSYKKLTWSKKKIIRSLKNEENRFWIDFKKIKKLALKNGFKIENKLKIDKTLYGNTHMFDFLLYK
jgi:ubiquinone/menaquinone biosynthesis C-methylase UbiE|tara:strand:+ start:530 stop:1222 length:693 start_codon:yes stop_codon:yes gene_type:complete